MEILAGLGGIFGLVLTALALVTPLMIYLIQRNTYQTRQEIRNLNKSIRELIDISKAKQPQPPAQPAAQRITMQCPECGKPISYSNIHSGKKKTCPTCNKSIVLK